MSALLAYFDPGSGSLLLQVLIGGSAGLVVFARYLWERLPSFLKRCQHDEPAREA
jgi:hypothetical protein